MDSSITPDGFAAALVKACKDYTDEVKEIVEEGVEKIGDEAKNEVKRLSPVYSGTDRVSRTGKSYHTTNKPKSGYVPGAYRRNWTYVIEKSRGVINVTVHVKGKHYRLTHLLENGHLNRDGTSRSKEIPHISIVQKHVDEKADRLIEEATNGT